MKKRKNLLKQKHDMMPVRMSRLPDQTVYTSTPRPLFHIETWWLIWIWITLVCIGIGYLIGVNLK